MIKKAREKRTNPRFLTQLKAHCFHVLSDGTSERATVKVAGVWSDKEKPPHSKGVIRDISFGGLQFESVLPFREGTILVIELEIPKRKGKVVVIGLVRWVKSVKNHPPYKHGLGIQFIYMQKTDWELLEKILKQSGIRIRKEPSVKRKKKK